MTTEQPAIMFDPMTQSPGDVAPDAERLDLNDVAPDAILDPAKLATCDRVRDLMPENPEFGGKVLLTCDKPLGHDRRGGHRMRNEAGKTTCTWTGPADND